MGLPTVPGQMQQHPARSESDSAPSTEAPGKVLLIDDSPVVLETVGALVESWGHVVVTAERADAGLRELEQTAFDIVIADISMPGMDGLELLAELNTRGLEMPVVMLSAASDTRTVLQAIHDGAFDYVDKEGGLEPLASAVQRALAHTRLLQENKRLLEEQRQMNQRLEEKVRARTLELEEVNRRLSNEHAELARAMDALRQTQSQLIQAEKMATIGLFTAGIAHEINNPLAFLLPDFEELERWVATYRAGKDPSVVMGQVELEQLLKDCRHGLQRIGRIVKQIAVFAHQSNDDIGRVEPNAAAANALRLLEKEAQRAQARIVCRLEQCPPVRANADQFQQVLFNLVLNAIQGLDPARADGCIEIGARPHAGEMLITVTDNGRGISARHLEKVFEPFFTTKRVGEGTGLGLSICRRLVQRMGGRLELTSREGQGTTAYLALPAWEASAPSESVIPDSDPISTALAEAASQSRRRLLVAVIDDEPALLLALRRWLGEEHDVVTFGDPVEAKEWLLYGPPPDLVLCDVAMPVLSGRDLYLAVTHAHPALHSRFLFVSGVRDSHVAEELRSQYQARVLEKPIDREALLAACPELGMSLLRRKAA